MHRVIVASLALLSIGCGMQDTTEPVPQPDTTIFGRIAAIRPVENAPGTYDVDIRSGLPETLRAVMQQERRAIPELEKDLTSRVRVTPDTVCVADMRAVDLDDFRAGQEVAVIPSPGTSAMIGTKVLLATAAEFYLFSSYQVRFIPRSLQGLPAGVDDRRDPKRINSSGVERTPLPLDGGRVVYFAAGLLPSVMPRGEPRGAVRAGMRGPDGKLAAWAVSGYRPYRTAFERGRWTTPEPVDLPGLPAVASARITWVDPNETRCLVTVEESGHPKELLASSRSSSAEPWGPLAKVDDAKGESVGDAQRFGTKGGALVWTVFDANGSDLWLVTTGHGAGPLEPRINTLGPEWAPRVGPGTTLYFCRSDRQLLYAGKMVQEVRLPGKQRRPLFEAAPTADGRYLFFAEPIYTSVQPDSDIAVAERRGKGWGAPVSLDDWRP
jgi:hypothetical protein